jgi:hypothetical protein
MHQIETWSRMPAALRAHLVERIHDRRLSIEDLNRLRVWIESKPEVPEGPWFKDFGSFKLCGEGKLPKRFLLLAMEQRERRGQPGKGWGEPGLG